MEILDDYVSFDLAKLLKEKGFNEKCQKVYLYDGTLIDAPNFMEGESFVDNDDIEHVAQYYNELDTHQHGTYAFLCPTINVARKWLKIVHKIGIFPSTYTFTNADMSEEYHPYGTAIVDLKTYKLVTEEIFPKETEEDAVEAAIKYYLLNNV